MIEKRYLLDTDTVSDLVRNPSGKVAQRIRDVGTDAVCISIITAAELRFGALKRGAARLSSLIAQLLEIIDVIALDSPIDEVYAEIRVDLERRGRPIGPNDLLIGAHARALGAILVTNNEREMRRVPGLTVENWLA